MTDDRLPVVLGVGQAIERDELVSPLDLAERAARAALEDAAGVDRFVQQVSMVGILAHGGKAPASRLARRLGLSPARCETTAVGGNTPQWLVTRAAAAIAAGRLDAVLIAGAEAMRSARAGGPPRTDGPHESLDPDPVVGDQRPGMSPAEVAAGVVVPAHVYPVIESTLAAAAGRTFAEQRDALGRLLAPFTEVAAAHPYAWFREERTADDISNVTPDNRLVAEPYTKRMNAFLGSDQAAAVIVTSAGVARQLGLLDRAVFVWAGASLNDVWHVPERPDLHRSSAIEAAAAAVFDAAGVGVDDVGVIDLYSCFPSAVQLAAEAIGLPLDGSRPLTVTGGLPFFGGPGNNYSTHAIATAVERVRDDGGIALVTALGWYVTKHAVGLYGASPPPRGFAAPDTSAAQAAIDATALEVVLEADGPATVEASTVVHDGDGAVTGAPVIARLDDGRRVVAAAADGEAGAVEGQNLVGARIRVAGSPLTYRLEDLSR